MVGGRGPESCRRILQRGRYRTGKEALGKEKAVGTLDKVPLGSWGGIIHAGVSLTHKVGYH